MGTASYLNVIEQYHDNREAIRELMASMVTGIADARLLYDEEAQRRTLDCLNEQYPFVELLFALDESGVQTSDNVSSRAVNGGCDAKVGSGRGKDRSQRPYFLLARESSEVVVTDPYLSSASRDLCLSAALQWRAPDGGVAGYMVVDVSLGKTVEFLMGDTDRRRFQPLFRLVYSLIVLGRGRGPAGDRLRGAAATADRPGDRRREAPEALRHHHLPDAGPGHLRPRQDRARGGGPDAQGHLTTQLDPPDDHALHGCDPDRGVDRVAAADVQVGAG
jgi:hypothetical protein